MNSGNQETIRTTTNSTSRIPGLALLGLASGASPFCMTIVVPVINNIAESYSASFDTVQFVISAYLFGLAIAQPVSGFLCDRFGRRSVMLAGFFVLTVASLACAMSENLWQLVAFRFLQALGASVGTVCARAILRDTRSGERMAESMSYVTAIMGFAPIVGPILGGFVADATDFRAVFAISAGLGSLVLIAMYFSLDETLDPDQEMPRWRDWFANYSVLTRSKPFIGNSLVYGFSHGAFFAFLGVGAAYFATAFLIETTTFGLIWGGLAVAFACGAALGGRYTRLSGADRVMRTSVISLVIVCATLMLTSSVWPASIWALMGPFSLVMVIGGALSPGAMAAAIRPHADMAGTASGLSSAIGLVISGMFTIISGALYAGRFEPIAGLILVAAILTLASWRLSVSPIRRSPALN